jgi:hypothetical protein
MMANGVGRMSSLQIVLAAVGAASFAGLAAHAAEADEFKIKREAVFEFAQKPVVTRAGDKVTVAFESKGLCDVTVAIENAQGKIVRHLASGVLGPRAPEPLQKDAKRQVLVWDGKNDQGAYVDDKNAMTVRVSLGLKARFEKNLYWSPHKRISTLPIMAAAPEGIYVYDGFGVDHLRLFDHDGKYLRTVHPDPANKIKDVQGLNWKDFPEGYRLPTKFGFYQQTLLNAGTNESIEEKGCRYGWAAVGLAVRGNRVALTYKWLNRLATDGSSGGLPLKGAQVGINLEHQGYGGSDSGPKWVGPSSLAFSPDLKTLYLTGWLWFSRFGSGAIPAVTKMDFEKDDAPATFVGNMTPKEGAWGDGDKQLNTPTSVAVDAAGRVYVSDYMNDRVQVFAPDGALVKSIKTEKPARVLVHQKSGEIYVLTWAMYSVPFDVQKKFNYDPKNRIATTVSIFSPLPEAKKLSTDPIDLGWGDPGYFFAIGQLYDVALDSWTDTPTLWIVGRKHLVTEADEKINASWAASRNNEDLWKNNIEIKQRRDGKWATTFSFNDAVLKAVKKPSANKHKIMYLWFNPKNERLYLGEPDSGPTVKACNELLKINPVSGAIDRVRLPFNALDLAFDLDGFAYLRSTDLVLRFDAESWREIPWDYGSEFKAVGDEGGAGGHVTPALSALVMPAGSPVCYHQGGMDVSAQGDLVVACHNRFGAPAEADRQNKFATTERATKYVLPMYPGRNLSSISTSVHVWDKHGQLVYDDAVPGLAQLDGVSIDAARDIYVMSAPARIFDGTRYFNDMSETAMKFKPGKGKIISTSAVIPLSPENRPASPASIYGGGIGQAWVQGAEWLYGGVGFAGFNSARGGGGCACWHGRFKVDYFGRTFAPAPFQYNVAVLDKSGNLILRIGQYGNADTGGPDSLVPVDGDGVGLFNGGYVTTHTDRRLFIGDGGNQRIVSVKLDYYATEKIALQDVTVR